MATADDLKTISSDLDTLKAAVDAAVADLSVPAVPSVGDSVLEAVIPVLTGAGYTVTPPAEAEDPAEEATETSEETPA